MKGHEDVSIPGVLDRRVGVRVSARSLTVRCFGALLGATMGIAFAVDAVEGQERVHILSEDPCRGCEIVIDSVFSLGTLDGPGAIGNVFSVARSPDGSWLVVSSPTADRLAVFGPDGTPRPPLGRRGEGPGEYQNIRWVRTHGETVHVLDMSLHRHTTYSGDLELLDTRRIEVPLRYALADLEVLDDSLIAMNAVLTTPDRVGMVIHLIGADGTILQSIADDPGGFQANAPETLWMRQMEKATTGGLWAAHVTRYRIDRWSMDGELREAFVRDADWFPDHTGLYRLDPRDPLLSPIIYDVWDDGEGLLWVLVRVVEPDWTDALVESESGGGGQTEWTIEDPDRAFDSLIEVIDVRSGSVVARKRTDQLFHAFVGAGDLVSFPASSDLIPRVTVWHVDLRARSPQ